MDPVVLDLPTTAREHPPREDPTGGQNGGMQRCFGAESLGQWVSGWWCRRVGWNCSFPPHPSLKAPVTLICRFWGICLEVTKESMCDAAKDRWCISALKYHTALKNSSKIRSVAMKNSLFCTNQKVCLCFQPTKEIGSNWLIHSLNQSWCEYCYLYYLYWTRTSQHFAMPLSGLYNPSPIVQSKQCVVMCCYIANKMLSNTLIICLVFPQSG